MQEVEILQLFRGDAAGVAVAAGGLVSQRIGGHGERRGQQVTGGVGLSQRIVSTGNLLVGNLFGEVVELLEFRGGERYGERGVEPEVAVQPEADGFALDAKPERPAAAARLEGVVDIVEQGAVPLPHAALHIGRRQIGHERGVRAALGDDAFSHIPRRVIVEMRQVAHQHVRPVRLRLGHVLSGREFQVAVRSEMDQRVGLESVLEIKIGRKIAVRRRHAGAVDQPEFVVTQRGAGLRKEQDITELQAGHGEAVAPHKQPSRRRPVAFHDLLVFRGKQRFRRPGFVLFPAQPHGMRGAEELRLRARGVRAHHAAFTVNEPAEGRLRPRKAAHVVPLLAQPQQEVVQ